MGVDWSRNRFSFITQLYIEADHISREDEIEEEVFFFLSDTLEQVYIDLRIQLRKDYGQWV